MRRITDRQELLDGPLDDLELLRGNLRDLRRINRHLGGVRLSALAFDALVGDGLRREPGGASSPGGSDHAPVTLLDVGTGAADIPVALIARAARSVSAAPASAVPAASAGDVRPARAGWLRVTGIDERAEVLDAARALDPAIATLGARGALTLATADGRALPYPDRTFDIAHASLVLHHLSPPDAVTLLREMARVSSSGVIVNDLLRSRRSWLGAWALTRVMTRNRYTRHDGPLSVQRAYTRRELRRMLEAAGLVVVWEGTDLIRHRWAAAARHPQP
jgi:ubiquinone/menaquinone biosynthesis C-methylase UbiE